MPYWGELKSLRGQSVGEVGLVMRAVFRICGKESQTGLQIVEKLATPLVRASSLLFMMRSRLNGRFRHYLCHFSDSYSEILRLENFVLVTWSTHTNYIASIVFTHEHFRRVCMY